MPENDLPLVSVIAICHKHADFVAEALDSIYFQTYPCIQLIIIENNSGDGSAEAIRKWIGEHSSGAIFIQNQKSYSLPENCNIGLQHVSGKYFQAFACDDIMLPDKLATQVAKFETLSPDYVCVYGDMTMVDQSGKTVIMQSYIDRFKKSFKINAIPNGNLRELLSKASVIPAPAALFRTSTIQNTGGYDERFSLEDWPMFIRLSRLDYKFFFQDEIVCKYRRMDGTLSLVVRYEKYNDLILLLKENKDYLDTSDLHYRQKWFNCVVYAAHDHPIAGLQKYFGYMRGTGDYRLKRFLQFIKYGLIVKSR